ncbi:TPA: RNA-binding protein [Candidatus Dependentiae bacterium]|nr:MAG: Rna binding protein [candidate division TM6 bacterium GW2011_GWE2_31_21]KKP53803.1 MAG: Rna binding protein [candidate division TM6 bacterium GW2011_GWF2_33_332]HBS47583.1 RNA-binding protein [Candidatus Dependentiae bacterium]HBZ73732.1 RNA-binding protein [Candidatus Dependentiae bacterium]
MNIFVGNLSRRVSENELRAAFEPFGEVASAVVIKDKFSGQSRGFGFVEMPNASEAQNAINSLNGTDLLGRTLNVNEAKPKPEGGSRPPRSGGNGGGFNRRPRSSNWN